jgi:2-polyprenyl-3-methyl-5-hydroxy-6-metoxy-1,4-benzoquinol methylase
MICGSLEINHSETRERFDVVSAFHVLEHVNNPRNFLKVMKQCLSDDAIVYIEVPNGCATVLQLADLLFKFTGKGWSTRLSPVHPPFHNVAFSPKSLYYLLDDEGYSILEMDTFSHPTRCRAKLSRKASGLAWMRNVLSWFMSFFPNREIVYVVAKITKNEFRI